VSVRRWPLALVALPALFARCVLVAPFALFALIGCGGTHTPIALTVVAAEARGGAILDRAVHTPIDDAVRLRVVHLPESASVDPAAERALADRAARLALARDAYVTHGDFDACLAALDDAALVPAALAAGDRDGAARVLTFRCACALARGDEAAALDVARTLGALGLAVPASADDISPRAERLLADAVVAAHAAPTVRVEVAVTPAGAQVALDGRASTCRAPCVLALRAGAHVIAATADGYDDAHTRIEVALDQPAQVALRLPPATPERAARQWRARSAAESDTGAALNLLQVAARDRRIVWFDAAPAPRGQLRVRLALAIDDVRPRRMERLALAADIVPATRAALRELLTEAGVIPPRPLYEEPLFWAAVVAAGLISGGISAALLFEPSVRVPVYAGGTGP